MMPEPSYLPRLMCASRAASRHGWRVDRDHEPRCASWQHLVDDSDDFGPSDRFRIRVDAAAIRSDVLRPDVEMRGTPVARAPGWPGAITDARPRAPVITRRDAVRPDAPCSVRGPGGFTPDVIPVASRLHELLSAVGWR
jgi:hypothetical protein